MSQKEDKGRLQDLYFGAALYYYIVGRYAVIARFSPISGNLIHHAIELYLKAALIEQLDEAPRRKFAHNLQKLWDHYKRQRNNPALDKFDQTIRTSTNLNEFVTPRK